MAPVYHFTDTIRLPWILQSGELRPGLARPEGWPADFLWATKNPILDGTSSAAAAIQSSFNPAAFRAVRIALPASAFVRWSSVPERFPGWTRDHIDGLEWHARGKSRPQDWMVRADPLPREKWLSVETRGSYDAQWFPLDTSRALFKLDQETLGVTIDGYVYASKRELKRDGTHATSPQGTPLYSPQSVLPLWEMALSRPSAQLAPARGDAVRVRPGLF